MRPPQKSNWKAEMPKIRSDSLYAELGRAELRDEFFAWFASASPSYVEMTKWLKARGVKSTLGALHNLVTVHYAQWRIAKSIEAADAEALALPENIDQQTRNRIRPFHGWTEGLTAF